MVDAAVRWPWLRFPDRELLIQQVVVGGPNHGVGIKSQKMSPIKPAFPCPDIADIEKASYGLIDLL
jgi:hypothetical protein